MESQMENQVESLFTNVSGTPGYLCTTNKQILDSYLVP